MTEQIQDQISAFMDDELSAEECEFFVRRLAKDPRAHSKAIRYATIGAALRGELLVPDPAALRRGVAQAISGVPAPVPPRAERRSWNARLVKPAAGVAIAASMAVVGVLALNQVNGLRSEQAVASVTADGRLADNDAMSEAPSYVVPQDTVSGQPGVPPIRLTNYLMRHGEYASGLGRQSIHSIVVGQDESPESPDAEPWK